MHHLGKGVTLTKEGGKGTQEGPWRTQLGPTAPRPSRVGDSAAPHMLHSGCCVWGGVCLLTTRSPGPQRALHRLCRMNEWVGGWMGGWGGGCVFRPLHLQEERCVPR